MDKIEDILNDEEVSVLVRNEILTNIGKLPKKQNKRSSYMLDPRIEHYQTIDDNLKQQVIEFCENNPGALLVDIIGMFCPEEETKKKNLGLIIGASVGGVVFIGLLIFLIIYFCNNLF